MGRLIGRSKNFSVSSALGGRNGFNRFDDVINVFNEVNPDDSINYVLTCVECISSMYVERITPAYIRCDSALIYHRIPSKEKIYLLSSTATIFAIHVTGDKLIEYWYDPVYSGNKTEIVPL